jgi:uncharacterized coiled-coil protein SlyX
MISSLETLEKCEQEAAELHKEANFYEEISFLISNIPNLLKAEQLLVSHKKKFEELRQIVMQNQKSLKQIESNLKLLKNCFSQSVTSKSQLNEEKSDLIRIIEIRKFEVKIKKECCELFRKLDREISQETTEIHQILDKSKQEIKNLNLRFSNFDLGAIEEASDVFEDFKERLISESVEFVKSKCLEIISEKISSFEQEITEEILSLDSLINK